MIGADGVAQRPERVAPYARPVDQRRGPRALDLPVQPQQRDVQPAVPPRHHVRTCPRTALQQRKIEIHRLARRLLGVVGHPESTGHDMGAGTHHIGGNEEPCADHLAPS
ncbi:hypothetical protein SALBM311S_07962 [Streptomyces alboniger]